MGVVCFLASLGFEQVLLTRNDYIVFKLRRCAARHLDMLRVDV